MEWSRIKTIILIILAVTNVSLLGFLVQREFQVQNARQEARQNSIQFLKNNGVTVEDETVPEEMTLLPQTVEWDRGQEREAAAVLLGGEVQEQAWSDEIYRYYNETGSIQFHRDGTFQGSLWRALSDWRSRTPPHTAFKSWRSLASRERAFPFRLTAGRRTL